MEFCSAFGFMVVVATFPSRPLQWALATKRMPSPLYLQVKPVIKEKGKGKIVLAQHAYICRNSNNAGVVVDHTLVVASWP